MVPWSSWTAVLRDAGLALSHTMPVSFNSAGTVMVLSPTLECDSKHVMGSDVRVEVELPTVSTTAVIEHSTHTTQNGLH